jgi:HAE1 family hydrophobic/amphiphilic exporter-1
MTAISSLVGFFPLLIATGAGSASRWSVGYTVFGGLLVATILSLLMVPVLYVVLKSLSEWVFSGKRPDPPAPPPSNSGNGTRPDTASEPTETSNIHPIQEGESPA